MREKLRAVITAIVIFLSPLLFANSTSTSANIVMSGELDDDLFIIRASKNKWEFIDCFQMHNPDDFFILDGVFANSIQIPGWIEYDKNISIGKNDILFIGLANEREEVSDEKALTSRTHYKSVELRVDNKVLIPSMMPEKNDLSSAPLWFNEEEDKGSNYYRAWENSIVNIGLVLPLAGIYTIELLSKQGVTVAKESFNISKYTQNIQFKKTIFGEIGSEPMTELDGGVFGVDGKFSPDDEKMKELAIYEIIITKGDDIVKIPLPYPFVYINRIFCKSLF